MKIKQFFLMAVVGLMAASLRNCVALWLSAIHSTISAT